MKTPEEINRLKTGLEYCASDECHGDRGECPYRYTIICVSEMAGQAREYIEQLEERIDLMLIQMHGDCGCCVYRGRPSYKSPCTECLCGNRRPMWKYEGLPEVKDG